jgi:hypothetical protein
MAETAVDAWAAPAIAASKPPGRVPISPARPGGPFLCFRGLNMNFSAVARRAAFSVRLCAAALLGLAALAGSATVAGADDVTFIMNNGHPNALRVELYSQDRDHVWPGGGEDYYLDDGESKEMSLACEAGESICYGAWIDGDENTYWGVGPNNAQTCDNCCYTCEGGETEEINLVP